MKLKCKYQGMDADKIIRFMKANDRCPFKDSICPDDVFKKFPKVDANKCCEYCVKTHYNDND